MQADPGTPLHHPESILRLAQASVQEGVNILRIEGVQNVVAVRRDVATRKCITIGLIKRKYDGCNVFITPTLHEVRALIAVGCEIVALDGTARNRPNESFATLVQEIHHSGALAMADCDSLESVEFALAAGADLIGTTLAGYTETSKMEDNLATVRDNDTGPHLQLVHEIAKKYPQTVLIAEGRFTQRWQVESAILAGATGVTIGGALNDPIKQTRALKPRFYSSPPTGIITSESDYPSKNRQIGAVDIGGTWLRFATFSTDWKMLEIEKEPNPHNHVQLIDWIASQVKKTKVSRVGVSTAGIVDPSTGLVWKAKEYLMPDHVGVHFDAEKIGVPTIAWGDGHATAWAHACIPELAGKRVATISIGTGVGCGFVQNMKIWAGPRGEYPTLNDLMTKEGKSFEDLLGGAHLTRTPTDEQKANAVSALHQAVAVMNGLYFADSIVVGGGVGLSDWMRPHLEDLGLIPSPLGTDAGIYGAAALTLFGPPEW